MVRIILFLVLIGAVALGAALVADQSGNVVLSWNVWRVETSLPIVMLALVLFVLVAMFAWWIVRSVLRAPTHLRRIQRERRLLRGRNAITQGLIAVGTGDQFAARRFADAAHRLAEHDPLTMLLQAQSAQLDGDSEGAQRAFHAMTERRDTRLLGLRGLFIEAQRHDDAHAAVALAEEALKIAPASSWASHAVLGFRCSQGDWDGALTILDNNFAAGLIDAAPYRRERGVLLTARALDIESSDRDRSRASVMEAVKVAPTLVPAATLAAKFLSESNQVRRAMQIVEAAWVAQPHPDLADAYMYIRLGDSATQRLARAEKLAARVPGHIEGALAVARAAIDASEFARAREVLQPFVEAPTQRVALLMAEIERAEHGDDARAREWMRRAVRAALDPAWTADGYVSDRWRPISPVTGRLDAFQWLTPVAALPSDKTPVIDVPADQLPSAAVPAPEPAVVEVEVPEPEHADGNEAVPAPVEPPPVAVPAVEAPPPVFRPRRDIEKVDGVRGPAVIPIVRAPDDPGVGDGPHGTDFDESLRPAQPGGVKGFLSRFVS